MKVNNTPMNSRGTVHAFVNRVVCCFANPHSSHPDDRKEVVVERIDGYKPLVGPDILEIFVIDICLDIT